MKKLQLGRSMIEMLGVLAIIGVLSVGAIAGYQKAMFKYKLNKQAQQLNTVINAVAKYAHSFDNFTEIENMFTYLIKLGEIPKEMIKPYHTIYIYDVFGNSLRCSIQPKTHTSPGAMTGVVALGFGQKVTVKSNQNVEMCKNLFNILKENRSSIYFVYSASKLGTDDARLKEIYGDKYCDDTKECLKDMDIQSIYEICSLNFGNGDGGNIFALWKL